MVINVIDASPWTPRSAVNITGPIATECQVDDKPLCGKVVFDVTARVGEVGNWRSPVIRFDFAFDMSNIVGDITVPWPEPDTNVSG